MARKSADRSVPEHALTVRTYAEFEKDVKLLAKGKYNFLLVIGNSGLSKTRSIEAAMGRDCAIISGKPTPFGFYSWCHEHMDKAILVMDDVAPAFYKDPTSNSLLKALTDTTDVKTLHWKSKAAAQHGMPDEFETEARVVILVNDWDSANEHIRAIEGRATTIIFKPSFMEVHRKVATWLDPKHDDVFQFMYENRNICAKPNMRLYVKGVEQKEAGNNWRQRLYEMIVGDERMQKFIQFMMDNVGTSNNKLAEMFQRKGMGGTTLFYQLLKAFKAIEVEDATPIKLGS